MSDMAERRYSDEEVQQILAQAAEAESTGVGLSRERGWTLADIQQVAREAGLDPTSVADAAANVGVTIATPSAPRILGAPVGVARVGGLTRAPTDGEWQRVVHLLRDTFAASGRENVDGLRHEWRNGNLRVIADRGGPQPRIELRTYSDQLRVPLVIGPLMTAVGAVVSIALPLAAHVPLFSTPGPAILAAGVGLLAVARIRAARWAATRREQFDDVVRFVTRLTSDADAAGEGDDADSRGNA